MIQRAINRWLTRKFSALAELAPPMTQADIDATIDYSARSMGLAEPSTSTGASD